MKKLITLLLVLTGCVGTVSATTKRIYLEAQNGWERVDLHLYSSTAENITGDWPGLQLTRIGTTRWFYGDVDSELTNARCIVSSNGWGQTLKDQNPNYYEIDLSKNNVIYLYNNGDGNNPTWDKENKNVLSIQNFTGYVVADGYTASSNTLISLTQNGLQLTGTLDLTSEVSNKDLWIYPTILSESTYYVGNLAIRPSGTSNYSLANFTNYTSSIAFGDTYKWVESAHQKYDITINLSTGSFTFTPKITGSITTAGYATYSHGSAYKITGDGVGVYTITATGAGEASMSATNWKDAALPAGTGVVLVGSTLSAKEYTVTPSDGSASIGTNLLVGSGDSEATITAEAGFEKYILANKENGVKFYKWDGSSENEHNKLGAHKAYLRVSTGSGAPEFFNFNFDFGGETTDLSEKVIVKSEKFATAPVYNLNGQRVMNPTKGLYIVNGRKVVIK